MTYLISVTSKQAFVNICKPRNTLTTSSKLYNYIVFTFQNRLSLILRLRNFPRSLQNQNAPIISVHFFRQTKTGGILILSIPIIPDSKTYWNCSSQALKWQVFCDPPLQPPKPEIIFKHWTFFNQITVSPIKCKISHRYFLCIWMTIIFLKIILTLPC